MMVARTLKNGQRIIIPDNVGKWECVMAAEAIELCSTPRSCLWKQAKFLQSVVLLGRGAFFPASVRTTLANYRKSLKRNRESL